MSFPKLFLICVILISYLSLSSSSLYNRTFAIEIPTHLSFNSVVAAVADSPCSLPAQESVFPYATKSSSTLKLNLKHNHQHHHQDASSKKNSLLLSAHKDSLRMQTLFGRRRMANKSARQVPAAAAAKPAVDGIQSNREGAKFMATLESGVSLGSGEYFMDVFIGTPPVHFSLILDTGSDLNWIQCAPCRDCFEQKGPIYDPSLSSSYVNLTCNDTRCGLVSSPDPTRPCRENEPCPYFYWYGDKSNTTGELALETFTVNLTSTGNGSDHESRRVDGVIFGCGHWNRGLFHGAAGLLGLGRGPLSFSSQLQSLYGHTFSYCLVDRNSDLSVSSKLIFGEDESLINHPNLNYTSFAAGKDDLADTFYYVHVKGIRVGGELLSVPPESWELAQDGTGGTIIDSGTTLSYFVEPAYRMIRDAFMRKVKYPLVEDFPVLNPCYNVSGVEKVEMQEFSIEFCDGAVWHFPMENYFIRLEPEEIMCLAILGTPRSSLSIIGNYQQQNFHIMYDTDKSRLGFAPRRCAEV